VTVTEKGGAWHEYQQQQNTFDIMASFCGLPDRSSVLKAATSMLVKCDPRYPQRADQVIKDEAGEGRAGVQGARSTQDIQQ
jgi:hypothetical protein